MAAEAKLIKDFGGLETSKMTLNAAAEPGDVIQYWDGRAAVVLGVDDYASGDVVTVALSGLWEIDATASKTYVEGTPCWWDESANAVHVAGARAAGDFDLGVIGEATKTTGASAAKIRVVLNGGANYTFGTDCDNFGPPTIQEVATAPKPLTVGGGWIDLSLEATSEAQCCSWMSAGSVPPTDKFAADIWLNIVDDGDTGSTTTLDAVFGVANDDHASNPDTIAESVFFSLSGNTVSISAESDDGTTEVAATDTTVDYTLSTTHLLQIVCTDNADIQLYIDGVNVLPSSVFKLDAATGPMKLLGLIEKSADATTGQYLFKGGVRRLDTNGAA